MLFRSIERAFYGTDSQSPIPGNTLVSGQISQQAAEALEADFREYWDFEGEIEGGFIYRESGTVELTAEEYRLRKEEADRDFSEAQIISFVPADLGAPGTGFDISSQESFAEYILSNGMD